MSPLHTNIELGNLWFDDPVGDDKWTYQVHCKSNPQVTSFAYLLTLTRPYRLFTMELRREHVNYRIYLHYHPFYSYATLYRWGSTFWGSAADKAAMKQDLTVCGGGYTDSKIFWRTKLLCRPLRVTSPSRSSSGNLALVGVARL